MWVEASDPTDPIALQEAASDAYSGGRRVTELTMPATIAVNPCFPAIPRVVLVRDVGLFSVGKDRRAAQVAGEIARHTMEIVAAAERSGIIARFRKRMRSPPNTGLWSYTS